MLPNGIERVASKDAGTNEAGRAERTRPYGSRIPDPGSRAPSPESRRLFLLRPEDVRALTEEHFRALHQRLGQRWMRMDGELEVLGGGPHLDGQRAFGNQFAGAGADQADTENAAALRIDDQLRQPLGPIDRDRAAGGAPRELRHLELDPLCLRLGFGDASPRELRIGEDDGRNE